MRRVAMLALAPLLHACAASQPATVIVIEAPTPPAVAAPPTHHSDICVADIRMRPIKPDSSTCFIDARVRDKGGELTFPCRGGDAEARFPGAHFRGRVSGGELDVSLQTTFDFEDGCRWVSEQHIRGSVLGADLDYAYTEAPAPGQSGCASACTARAKVAVRRRQSVAGD